MSESEILDCGVSDHSGELLGESMRAMVLETTPGRLRLKRLETPRPAAGQLLLRVSACGVCRTDLHIVDGELSVPKLPLVPGHEIVGRVVAVGEGAGDADEAGLEEGPEAFRVGDRVGVPWLGYTDGSCRYCRSGRENLCDNARFTGYTLDGGYAEYVNADRRYCFKIPERYGDVEAAPFLCAGLIGYRCYRMAKDECREEESAGAIGGSGRERDRYLGIERLGLYGFGGAAHILAQLAVADGVSVYAFTRPSDSSGQAFARKLGAVWAGSSEELPPDTLDAAIVFAPRGDLVVRALEAVDRGGRVICGGIHMSDIPSFPYRSLWHERELRSVANLTRADGIRFMEAIDRTPVETTVHEYALENANEALDALREGRFDGAAVLVP